MLRGAGGLLAISIAVLALWSVFSSLEEEATSAPPPTSTSSSSVPPSTTSASTTTVTTTPATTTTTAPSFSGQITTVDAERLAHSWQEGCPVGPEDLSLIGLTHWGFDGETHEGELIVHSDHAEAALSVFQALFDEGYPIESVIPIGDLGPDAESDPDYSNTSGFHCRNAVGSSNWSEHARGLAIDINPHLNPYIAGDRIEPSGAGRYTDRTLDEPGMISAGDEVVTAFEEIGWSWGGHWRTLKDYHHFSATGR